MNSNHKEFIKFLKEEVEEESMENGLKNLRHLLKGGLNEEAQKHRNQNELKQLIYQLSSKKEKKIIVNRLDLLSDYLQKSFFHKNNRIAFLLETMRDNISKGVLTENEYIITDVYFMLDGGFSPCKALEIQLGLENKYLPLLDKDEKDLTPKERKKLKKFKKGSEMSHHGRQMQKLIKAHKVIKEHLFDKENTFTKEDIEDISQSLEDIGIHSQLCRAVRNHLERNLKKRTQKPKEVLPCHFIEKKELSKDLVNDKEYKEIKKEIKGYYQEIIRKGLDNITEEEILDCAQLMLRIGTEEKEIITFLEQMKPKQQHPIARYLQEYDRLKYYEEKLELEESMKTMEGCFEEIFISTPSDYEFWKGNIEETLNSSLKKISNKHEYEMVKIKTYQQKKDKK